MWCWERLDKISWSDRVRDDEVLHTGLLIDMFLARPGKKQAAPVRSVMSRRMD